MILLSIILGYHIQASANFSHVRTEDHDLAMPRTRIHRFETSPNQLLTPDYVTTDDKENEFVIQFEREIKKNGQVNLVPLQAINLKLSNGQSLVTDAQGRVHPSSCENGNLTVRATMENNYFNVSYSSKAYRLEFQVPCSGYSRVGFKFDSNAGQVMGIWSVAVTAWSKLQEAVGLNFWTNKIQINWPGDGDYYSWGTVNITRGEQWDVVGHELGHAIYDIADLGRFGGGPHKIDECYSTELALSEGWASFFSAWVSLGVNDPDAKFEFMVPRRAPINIENIPNDVCKGEKNEWRVTGFFWDLVDTHDDGETMKESFSKLWNAMTKSMVGSASAVKSRMKSQGFDSQEVERIWQLNLN